jgi:hypothetical protein
MTMSKRKPPLTSSSGTDLMKSNSCGRDLNNRLQRFAICFRPGLRRALASMVALATTTHSCFADKPVSSRSAPRDKTTGRVTLRTIQYELLETRQIKQGLPRLRAPRPERKPAWYLLPTIDWLWMKIAFKAALAAALSLLFIRWIHPPGPAALLFSVLQCTFMRAGGKGDLRALQRLF